MQKEKKSLLSIVNRIIVYLDNLPLGWLGIPLLLLTFLPYMILKDGSVFEIHDQLDETLLTYVLNAKYLGQSVDIFPEMLGGINPSGMQPSAILFIPLYALFPTLTAFLLQYLIVCASSFFGMYLSVKRITSSSILALLTAGCFCLLPFQPVYGLSIAGVPLLLYAFLCLYDKKNLIAAYLMILFFGVTTHLVLIGYVMLGLWALYLIWLLVKKQCHKHIFIGFGVLTGTYLVVNYQLFIELFFRQSTYVSHREELINTALPFWDTFKTVFLESAQHAPSKHIYLIIPIIIILVYESFLYRKKEKKEKQLFWTTLAGFAGLIGIAFFYALCKTEYVAALKNNLSGFLRYFQMERFYWLYPSGWLLEFALVFRLWWDKTKTTDKKQHFHSQLMPLCKLIVLVILLYPMANQIKYSSYFYMNVNQINNGSQITGYTSWENYYSEDLMQNIEDTIGRDMTEYRVAHLGISPAPSLMHGFYTVDGYSNNYSLEYKHSFREVIASELEKNEDTKIYFDEWGSRCYLFNSQTGTYYNLKKGNNVKFEGLEFDMDALKNLDCEYIFSGAEIVDAERMELSFMGYYETEESYWGIWVYKLI